MAGEERAGVRLTNLDQPLFDDAGATKRDLVDYLDALAGRFVPVLSGRALSVVRVLRGQAPFMQKNLPSYAPAAIPTLEVTTQDGKRVVRYPVCDDLETLLWFANQRAVEYHPTLFRGRAFDAPTHLVLDLDPPAGSDAFPRAVNAAQLVREVLSNAGMTAMASSGAKGVHVVVPLLPDQSAMDVAAATRAVATRAERLDPTSTTTAFVVEERGGKVFLDSTRAGGATVVAAYSPRVRAGVPVSFPLAWDQLAGASPAEFTIHTVPRLLGDTDPWTTLMPPPQILDRELVEEGNTIPVARVAAMHEGKRRARARQAAAADDL